MFAKFWFLKEFSQIIFHPSSLLLDNQSPNWREEEHPFLSKILLRFHSLLMDLKTSTEIVTNLKETGKLMSRTRRRGTHIMVFLFPLKRNSRVCVRQLMRVSLIFPFPQWQTEGTEKTGLQERSGFKQANLLIRYGIQYSHMTYRFAVEYPYSENLKSKMLQDPKVFECQHLFKGNAHQSISDFQIRNDQLVSIIQIFQSP